MMRLTHIFVQGKTPREYRNGLKFTLSVFFYVISDNQSNRISRKGRTWSVSRSYIYRYIRVLFVDIIEEKDCILFRVEKAKCFIYEATIE